MTKLKTLLSENFNNLINLSVIITILLIVFFSIGNYTPKQYNNYGMVKLKNDTGKVYYIPKFAIPKDAKKDSKVTIGNYTVGYRELKVDSI
jgi:hypothetical protein